MAKTIKPNRKPASDDVVRRRGGRPSKYTPELAAQICDEIASGRSLNSVCQDKYMPDKSNVFIWLSKYEEFRDNYTRACEERGEFYAERALEVAEDDRKDRLRTLDEDGNVIDVKPNSAAVQRSKLIVDTYKWFAAKLAPKKYSERVQVAGDGDKGAIEVEHKFAAASDEELQRVIVQYAAEQQAAPGAAGGEGVENEAGSGDDQPNDAR
jgi:hypothetical protein